MRHFKNKQRILFLIGCLFSAKIFAADIGSDTSVSRFNTQVSVSSGDRIAGFASMGGGFELDPTVEAVFDSFFEVSGPVNLTGGTLCLNRDLRFRDPAAFEKVGNIIGNDHTLSLSQTVTVLPRLPYCNPESVASVQPDPTPLDYSCEWSFDDTFVAIGTQRDDPNDQVYVYTFDQTTNVLQLISLGRLADFTQDAFDISFHPNRNIYAVAGRIFGGTSVGAVLLFGIPGSIALQELDNSIFASGVSAVDWHPTGDWLAVGSVAAAGSEVAILFFDTTTERFATTPVVTVTLGRQVENHGVDWDATGTYLAVGTVFDGSADELLVFEFDRTNSTLIVNASANTGLDTVVAWNKTETDLLAAGMNNGATSGPVTIYQHDRGSGGGAQDGSLTAVIETAADEGILAINWSPDGNCLGVGTLRFSGIEQVTVWAFDSANLVLEKVFTDATAALGAVNDIKWSNNNKFIATAEEVDRLLMIYKDQDSLQLMGLSDTQFVMNNGLLIQGKRLLFTGENILNGNGNVLTLNDDDITTLIPDSNSTLHVKNITIDQVHASNIANTDMSSTITLEDLTLILDGNFSFTLGQVDIVGTVNIIGGGHTLTWESDQELTIGTESKLILGPGVTFDYDPAGNSRNLLVFTDSSSELVLSKGSILNAGTSGINLTKGTLRVNANATLSAESSGSGTEIRFGDNSSATNDMKVEIGSSIELQVSQGALDHKNVTSTSVNFNNDKSTLSMAASTILRINQTINTGDGIIVFGNPATVAFAMGKQITGRIAPEGTLTYASL